MKTIRQQAEEYASKYPIEQQASIVMAWMDGRKSAEKEKKKRLEIDLSFVNETYMDLVIYWIGYHKEKKLKYTQIGIERFYSRLLKLSGGDKEKMIEIIDQSVSNNYTGIFELKGHGKKAETRNIFSISE